jgi:nucleoside-diphosphate-sugar epimerase
MRVLVTGGAGFIGSHLVKALIADGATVRVLDDLSSGSRANLQDVPVEFIEGSIVDWETVRAAVDGCELVFHQAAVVSVPYSIEDPWTTYQTNVTGTFNVFEAARQARLRRVVYASSSAVYGNLPGIPKREESKLAAISPYAATKQMNEVLAGSYTAAYGMELVGLRYMNVFGPRQDPSSPYSGVLSIFCQAMVDDRQCTIHGDGEQTRDFVFVADVVQANLLSSSVPLAKLPRGAIFNVGRGEQTSLNEIVDMLTELANKPLPVIYGEERAGDIKHSVADIRRARHVLGFTPQTSVLEGLRQTLDWFGRQ